MVVLEKVLRNLLLSSGLHVTNSQSIATILLPSFDRGMSFQLSGVNGRILGNGSLGVVSGGTLGNGSLIQLDGVGGGILANGSLIWLDGVGGGILGNGLFFQLSVAIPDNGLKWPLTLPWKCTGSLALAGEGIETLLKASLTFACFDRFCPTNPLKKTLLGAGEEETMMTSSLSESSHLLGFSEVEGGGNSSSLATLDSSIAAPDSSLADLLSCEAATTTKDCSPLLSFVEGEAEDRGVLSLSGLGGLPEAAVVESSGPSLEAKAPKVEGTQPSESFLVTEGGTATPALESALAASERPLAALDSCFTAADISCRTLTEGQQAYLCSRILSNMAMTSSSVNTACPLLCSPMSCVVVGILFSEEFTLSVEQPSLASTSSMDELRCDGTGADEFEFKMELQLLESLGV